MLKPHASVHKMFIYEAEYLSWVIHLISISFIYFQGEMASSALRRFIAYHKISIHSSWQSETKMGLLLNVQLNMSDTDYAPLSHKCIRVFSV